MEEMKKLEKRYMMLNKDDITDDCGTITAKELKKELNFTSQQLNQFVHLGKIFRNKYILIEDDEYEDQLILEVEDSRKYYATADGRFYVIYRSGLKREIYPFPKRKGNKMVLIIKLNKKEYFAKNIIASAFFGWKSRRQIVRLKDGNYKDLSVDNIEIIDKNKSHSLLAKKIGLFEKNQLVKTYPSVAETARQLNISDQTVRNYCGNLTKKHKYDLRYV